MLTRAKVPAGPVLHHEGPDRTAGPKTSDPRSPLVRGPVGEHHHDPPQERPAITRMSHSEASHLLRGRKDGPSIRMLAGYRRPDSFLLLCALVLGGGARA